MSEIIRLYTSTSKFVLQTTSNEPVLEIDRHTQTIQLTNNSMLDFDSRDALTEIFGVIGIINLLRGAYLIVITERKCVGVIKNSRIWQITNTKMIPFTPTVQLPEAQECDEEMYLKLMQQILSTEFLYYSTNYDITHTVQYNFNLSESEKQKPIWERADNRFFWNRYLMEPFILKNMHAWIIPVMMGFIQFDPCDVNNVYFELGLISRRSCKRAGTRYNVRGIDMEGNVANFVETEQILLRGEDIISFFEIRGSIPLYWSQKCDLRYKPVPSLSRNQQDTLTACRRHFDDLIRLYGKQVVVNLIDHHAEEHVLGEAYEGIIRVMNNPDIRYIAYDFHKQTKGMRYEKLKVLLDQVALDLEKTGFCHVEDGKITSAQYGTFRTNCIDNLDRTNVVQSLFARRLLELQFIKLGIISPNETIQNYSKLERTYKEIWVNNGNALSIQYAGTMALKTDITKTGKRTPTGAWNDLSNSIMRYFINNFKDGYRQDAYDLFLGNYIVNPGAPSPYRSERNLWYFVLILIGAFMLGLTVLQPAPDTGMLFKLMTIMFWLVASYVAIKTVMFYGPDIVNKPSLVPNR